MSGHLASLAVLGGLGLSLALGVSLAMPLLWPLVRRALEGRSARTRAGVAWLAAVAPVLLPTAGVALCALPGLAGALVGLPDHCAAHGEHPHFCPVHATVALSQGAALLLLLLTLCAALFGVGLVRDLRRSGREARWLARRQAGSLAPGIHRLDDTTPFALTHGLFRPSIWISRTLESALSPEERAAVLAHEGAHVERRDPARLAAAALASRLHWPHVRAGILAELRLATEQVCDARAARAVGDPLRVAATLLRVERLLRGTVGGTDPALRLAAPLLDASLPLRIEALLASDAEPIGRAHARSALHVARLPWRLVLAALALALASPLHHAAEHVLEAVIRSMVGPGGLS